jgi:hypothetical protein
MPTPPPEPSVEERPAPPKGSLWRKDVQEVVDQGLGYFLQRVSVDADVHNGRFKGFRIVELAPPDFWQGVDLQPGDVVTQVNGMPIERETEAYAAFESLRSATELRVTFLRNGQQRHLVFAIVEPGGGTKETTKEAEPPKDPATPRAPPALTPEKNAG